MANRKPQQLAAVRIGYLTFLVDAARAGQIVALLAHAMEAKEKFTPTGYEYELAAPVDVEYRLVRPSQVLESAQPSPARALLPARAAESPFSPFRRAK